MYWSIQSRARGRKVEQFWGGWKLLYKVDKKYILIKKELQYVCQRRQQLGGNYHGRGSRANNKANNKDASVAVLKYHPVLLL